MQRSIAARGEHGCFRSFGALRCVSKHEGAHSVAVPTASGYGFRPSPLSRLGRNDELKGLSPSNTSPFPRRVFRARVLFFASLTRNEGWAEHRETYRRSCEAPVGRAQRSTPGACEAPCVPCARDARLSALHRGDFGLRSRASLTGLASGSVTASSSHPGPSARRAGFRASRGERLPAACRGTPLLAPSSRRCSRRHPSGARMGVYVV